MVDVFSQTYSNALLSAPVAKPTTTGSSDALRQKAEEFETGFLQTMLATMMETVEDDSITGQSFAKDSYQGMLVEQFAKEISVSGGIGLADHVYRELISAQEGAS